MWRCNGLAISAQFGTTLQVCSGPEILPHGNFFFPFHLSIYPPTHPLNNPSFLFPSTPSSLLPFLPPSLHPSFHPSIHTSIHSSIYSFLSLSQWAWPTSGPLSKLDPVSIPTPLREQQSLIHSVTCLTVIFSDGTACWPSYQKQTLFLFILSITYENE